MNLATFLQEQRIISIRDFIKNLSKITSHPTSKIYTLVKNGRKVGTYIPEESETDVLKPAWHAEEKKYKSFFDNYDKLCFSTNDPKLSEKVDEIVYGIK